MSHAKGESYDELEMPTMIRENGLFHARVHPIPSIPYTSSLFEATRRPLPFSPQPNPSFIPYLITTQKQFTFSWGIIAFSHPL
jgi:hypothetical protein